MKEPHCIICYREFKSDGKRKVTCSKRCSRIYVRVCERVNDRWRTRLERSGIKLSDLKK